MLTAVPFHPTDAAWTGNRQPNRPRPAPDLAAANLSPPAADWPGHGHWAWPQRRRAPCVRHPSRQPSRPFVCPGQLVGVHCRPATAGDAACRPWACSHAPPGTARRPILAGGLSRALLRSLSSATPSTAAPMPNPACPSCPRPSARACRERRHADSLRARDPAAARETTRREERAPEAGGGRSRGACEVQVWTVASRYRARNHCTVIIGHVTTGPIHVHGSCDHTY